jgi:hypothetical protein
VADSEVRQKDDPATYGLAFSQARRLYEVLTGKKWPRDGRESSVPEIVRAAYKEGMRAGEIAQREEIADLEEQLRDAYAAIERKNL